MANPESDKETKKPNSLFNVILGLGVIALGLSFIGHLHHGPEIFKK